MVELREEFVWGMDFVYSGEKYSFSWAKSYDADSGVLLGAWAGVVKQGSEERVSEDVRRAVFNAAAVFRVMELRAETNFNSLSLLSDREVIKRLVVEFAERSWEGDYLGQLSGSNSLYVQELAEILGLSLSSVLPLVDELRAEGRVGLTGYIFIPHEAEVASKQRLYESTGHRSLSVSDFGYWACSSCYQSGDEMTDPADFKCVDLLDS